MAKLQQAKARSTLAQQTKFLLCCTFNIDFRHIQFKVYIPVIVITWQRDTCRLMRGK